MVSFRRIIVVLCAFLLSVCLPARVRVQDSQISDAVVVSPNSQISDLRIDAHSDGSFHISSVMRKGVRSVRYVIEKDGHALFEAKTKDGELSARIDNPVLWTGENPVLYTLRSFSSKAGIVEEHSLRFAFRDVSYRDGKLCVNGIPVAIKAVSRENFARYGGALASRSELEEDILLLKKLNANSVRNIGVEDKLWNELCDEYGIYILDSNVPDVLDSGNLNDFRHAGRSFEQAHCFRYVTTYAEPEEASKGRVHVFNGQNFNDLSKVRMVWSLVADGKEFKNGKLESLNVNPQRSVVVKLAYDVQDLPKDRDVFLNVKYILKQKDGLLEVGSEVSHDQILINESTPVFIFGGGNTFVEEFGNDLVFFGTARNGRRWEMRFGEKTGLLRSFVIGGSKILTSPLIPCFGSSLSGREGIRPEVRLKMIKLFPGAKLSVQLEVGGVSDIEMTYFVNADGSMEIQETMLHSDISDPSLPFGVIFEMPSQFSVLDFYGRGPYSTWNENTPGSMVGRFVTKVDGQLTTHSGVRWMRLLDEADNGIEFASKEKFIFSVVGPEGKSIQIRSFDQISSNNLPRTFKFVIRPLFGSNGDGMPATSTSR